MMNPKSSYSKILFHVLLILTAGPAYSQPGKNGTLTISQGTVVVNSFAVLTKSAAIGDQTVQCWAGPNFSVCNGDLVMIYQAQGASINTVGAQYGNITSMNGACHFEFAYITAQNGNVLNLQSPLTTSFSTKGNTQLIKVPQYNVVNIQSGGVLTTRPWRDTMVNSSNYRIGGLLVVHASTINNNGTITAAGMGFRGGAQDYDMAFVTGITSYVSANSTEGAEKGESIAGSVTDYDLIGGRYCYGSPANGGGGGNAHNSAGGGGANASNGNPWNGNGQMIVDASNPQAAWALSNAYAVSGNTLSNSSGGGRGGYSWSNVNLNALSTGPNNASWQGDTRREVGGYGGRPIIGIDPDGLLCFGGGGGAAEANNQVAPGGGNGGGLIYLIATNGLNGNGLINANGNTAKNLIASQNDGCSGGGAGGSIVVKGNVASGQTLTATGGDGASQGQPSSPAASTEADGPGGGGGGGYIAISSGAPTTLISGGMNGITQSPSLTEFPYNGSTRGADGNTGIVSAAMITYTAQSNSLSISPPTPTACSGSTVSLAAFGASSYNWVPGNISQQFYNVTPTVTTVYTVTGTDGQGCSIGQATVNVQVTPLPAVSASASPTVACLGNTVQLTANGAFTFTWNPGAFIGVSQTITPLVQTQYTVTGTGLSGCIGRATLTVMVSPLPTVSIKATPTVVCLGAQVQLVASGASTFTWNQGGTNGSTYVATPTTQTTYWVNGGNQSGCVSSASIVVKTSLCDGVSENLNDVKLSVSILNDETMRIVSGRPDIEFRMFDMTGRLVMSGKLEGTSTIIDITSLSPGVYVLTTDRSHDGYVKFMR